MQRNKDHHGGAFHSIFIRLCRSLKALLGYYYPSPSIPSVNAHTCIHVLQLPGEFIAGCMYIMPYRYLLYYVPGPYCIKKEYDISTVRKKIERTSDYFQFINPVTISQFLSFLLIIRDYISMKKCGAMDGFYRKYFIILL